MRDASDSSSPSKPCRCTRCAANLSGLSAAARFCPYCGLRLSDRWHATLGTAATNANPPSRPSADPVASSTDVLRGYATAMFRLGAHYEFRHNEDEAVRCYGKASRLGNEPARVRLADIPFARAADTAS